MYIWDSKTPGNPGSRLVIQDDGNLVIYRPNNVPIWNTETGVPQFPSAQGDDMQPGEALYPDESIWSANGRFRFIYQTDGNLVLYGPGGPLWNSQTGGKTPGVCVMQNDGNLVIYGPRAVYIWDSKTPGNPGSRLVIQDDGNLVIYRPNNDPIWSITCKAGIQWTNYPATQSLTPYSTCRPSTLDGLIASVREAEASHKRVHPFGSKWSFSDCAFTPDYVIDTTDFNRQLQTVQRALKPGQSLKIYHVEAGIKIRNLYENLNGLGLGLETMGGASGQTLAGAVSTGTHGGDKFMSPLSDSVLAIHLVGTRGTQFWIEPSNGITDPALLKERVVQNIDPKNIIYDDATFNSCLVSMGCMGIIYAVVLKVRPQYDLVETTVETTWQSFRENASAYLKDPKNRFLQVIVNPYPNSKNQNLCLVTTRSEASATKPGQRPAGNRETAVKKMIGSFGIDQQLLLKQKGVFDVKGLSDEQALAKIVEGVLTYTPEERPKMIEHYWKIVQYGMACRNFRGLSHSVMDLGYGTPIPSSQPGHSIEMFFPIIPESGKLGFADFVNRAIEGFGTAAYTFFAGYMSLRFTGPSRAYLGMQRWNPTCSVEISILQGVRKLPDLLGGHLNIGLKGGGYAHWGQHIEWAHTSHGSVYPGYLKWRQIYAKMSSNFTVRTFENALSLRWNLTTPNDAYFISQTAPEVMEPGQTQSVTVTMENTGISTWTRQGLFRLGSQTTNDIDVWSIKRVDVPTDVLPGERVTFRFNITAPNKEIGSGRTYFFQWRMLQEFVEWFGIVNPLTPVRVVPIQGTTAVGTQTSGNFQHQLLQVQYEMLY